MISFKRVMTLCLPPLLWIGGTAGCAVQQETAVCSGAGGEMHGTPLQEVMCTLKRAVYEDEHRSELERDDLRRRYALNLADTVAALTEEIADVETMMPKLRPGTGDADAYAAYTEALKGQGKRIRAIAEGYETEKIDHAVSEMIRICNRCHARFGGPRL
jgi:hypothetical protein